MEKLKVYRSIIKDMDTKELLTWGVLEFGIDNIVLASSFSIEDQVLTYLFHKINKEGRIFTLDTGRLFNETYEVMQYTQNKYDIHYEIGFPDREEIRKVVSEKGPNFFRDSLDDRKECCRIRKMEPLGRILKTADSWVCGLRREQSVTRTDINKIEWDSGWGIYKLNPLIDWSEQDVWNFIETHKVPYNPLQKKGFSSIGCACCTRAVLPGEDFRAGRWWWEDPEHKECGLHRSSFTTVNIKGK